MISEKRKLSLVRGNVKHHLGRSIGTKKRDERRARRAYSWAFVGQRARFWRFLYPRVGEHPNGRLALLYTSARTICVVHNVLARFRLNFTERSPIWSYEPLEHLDE